MHVGILIKHTYTYVYIYIYIYICIYLIRVDRYILRLIIFEGCDLITTIP